MIAKWSLLLLTDVTRGLPHGPDAPPWRVGERVVENHSLGEAFCEREDREREDREGIPLFPVGPMSRSYVRRTPFLASGFQPLGSRHGSWLVKACVTSVSQVSRPRQPVQPGRQNGSRPPWHHSRSGNTCGPSQQAEGHGLRGYRHGCACCRPPCSEVLP